MESEKKKEPALTLAKAGMEDTVILKLNGMSFKVNRTKLSQKSLYFKGLFSGNFIDSKKTEFDIKFVMDLETFKTFVDWLDDEDLADDIWGHYYTKSISKYSHSCYKELLVLFRFAFFYAVDKLLDSLLYIIVDKWLKPENLIEIWSLAEELSLENLRKAAFAMCLDLFESLPQDSLFSLRKDKFELLVNNANIRCTKTHRQYILNEWVKYIEENKKTKKEDENQKKDTISSQDNTQNHKPSRVLPCITTFKTNANACEEISVFFWNETRLEELVKLQNGDNTYTYAGAQILGRGYSIYVVGGEKTIGQGNFNFYITRYCLLTKQWHRVERLLEGRRHMVAAFLGSKLVLAGGVGKFRVKLTSVHILDIHTGVWTRGEDVPQSFTDNPPACIAQNKLFVALSDIYSYDLRSNKWTLVVPVVTMPTKNILHYNNKLYVVSHVYNDKPTKVKIWLHEREELNNDFICVCQEKIQVGPIYSLITIGNRFLWFIIKDHWVEVQVGELESERAYQTLLSYCDKRNDKICFKPYIGCFTLLNPNTLFLQRDNETSS